MKKEVKNLSCSDCGALERGVFCGLDHDALGDLSAHKVTNTYKKGQTLFFQGNPPYGLYCINSGKIKLAKIASDGKESIIRIATGGDILGHRSLFTDKYYDATATALEDSTICFYDKKFILNSILNRPQLAMNLIVRLSRDMGVAESKLASIAQKNVRERLAELLLALKASFGVKVGEKWKLDIKLTREEMASMIGMANETLIRFLSELKDDGLIEQEGKIIYILDEAALLNNANVNY